jgi:hypothetical protein
LKLSCNQSNWTLVSRFFFNNCATRRALKRPRISWVYRIFCSFFDPFLNTITVKNMFTVAVKTTNNRVIFEFLHAHSTWAIDVAIILYGSKLLFVIFDSRMNRIRNYRTHLSILLSLLLWWVFFTVSIDLKADQAEALNGKDLACNIHNEISMPEFVQDIFFPGHKMFILYDRCSR